MPKFIVLARDLPDAALQISPEEMQRAIVRYTEWTDEMKARGRVHLSHKLRDGEGRVVRGAGDARSVTDGPFAEVKEIIGGFWIIEADDLDDAVETMASHPHLEHGGLEIREIEVLDVK
jgi:hypothetical protein